MPRAVAGEIRVVSFNIQKNFLYMDAFLESNINLFDIIFIQEPPWRHIRSAPSAHNKEGEDVVGPPMHPAWKLLMRPPQNGVPLG